MSQGEGHTILWSYGYGVVVRFQSKEGTRMEAKAK